MVVTKFLTILLSPYCPEQNKGVLTIMESARSTIYHAGLPLDFWAEACNTAVYIHNRSPTTCLKEKTPNYSSAYLERNRTFLISVY